MFDKKAQIKSLGSWFLYQINQGRIAKGEAIDEQIAELGMKPSNIDYVLISHLDCDHANGLRQVKEAKRILVSKAELIGTTRKNFQIRIRFQKRCTEGPVGKSYDVLGDGSLLMVNIPGHSEGLCALKIKNADGKYVLLFADGGYATKSWRDMITSGITLDKKMQRQSLQWIREQSMSPDCIESLATHDTEVQPHVIEI